MYCSALKLMDLCINEFDQPLEWQELEVKLPKYIIVKKLPRNLKGFEAKHNRSLCVGCNFLIKDNTMYEIPLNIVVTYFEQGKEPSEQGDSLRENKIDSAKDSVNRSDLVPKVIKRFNPSINNFKYEEMKNSSN